MNKFPRKTINAYLRELEAGLHSNSLEPDRVYAIAVSLTEISPRIKNARFYAKLSEVIGYLRKACQGMPEEDNKSKLLSLLNGDLHSLK